MPRIKASPEDFVVEEIPAYEPCGDGEHLYVRIEKRGRATDEAVREIARALGIQARDVGVAGLKDKVGVTRQTISMTAPRGTTRADFEAHVRGLDIADIAIVGARWHKNKLKTGHLRGNRFDIVVREIPEADADGIIARLEEAGRVGVPNAFGPQRFGPNHRNVERARAWLSGKEPGPRDPKARRFSFSAWQSFIFNEVLARRVDDGSWCTALEGDLMQKHATGGLFVCTDVQTDQQRAQALEISATGPMIGEKMKWPEGRVRDLEREIVERELDELGLSGDSGFFARHLALGEGTRRVLRQWVGELKVSREQLGSLGGPGFDAPSSCAIRVQFVLPSGAYATTVLSRAISDLSEREPLAEPLGGNERTELTS